MRSACRAWYKHCRASMASYELAAGPEGSSQLVDFAVWLVQEGYAGGTVRQYVSKLVVFNQVFRNSDVPYTAELSMVVEGAVRVTPPPRSKAVLSAEALRRVLRPLSRECVAHMAIRCAVLFMFHTGSRASNVVKSVASKHGGHALRWRDVAAAETWHDPRAVCVTLRHSKTQQRNTQAPTPKWVGKVNTGDDDLCFVSHLVQWRTMCEARGWLKPSRRVFRVSSSVALTAAMVNEFLATRCEAANVGQVALTTHALRVSFVSNASLRNLPRHLVYSMAGFKEPGANTTMEQVYRRPHVSALATLAGQLVTTRDADLATGVPAAITRVLLPESGSREDRRRRRRTRLARRVSEW